MDRNLSTVQRVLSLFVLLYLVSGYFVDLPTLGTAFWAVLSLAYLVLIKVRYPEKNSGEYLLNATVVTVAACLITSEVMIFLGVWFVFTTFYADKGAVDYWYSTFKPNRKNHPY